MTNRRSHRSWGVTPAALLVVVAAASVFACGETTITAPVIPEPGIEVTVTSASEPSKKVRPPRTAPAVAEVGTCYVSERLDFIGPDSVPYSVETVSLRSAKKKASLMKSGRVDMALVRRFSYIAFTEDRGTVRKANCVIPRTETDLAEVFDRFVTAGYAAAKAFYERRAGVPVNGATPAHDAEDAPQMAAVFHAEPIASGAFEPIGDEVEMESPLSEPRADPLEIPYVEPLREASAPITTPILPMAMPSMSSRALGYDMECGWYEGQTETIYCNGATCMWNGFDAWECTTDVNGRVCRLWLDHFDGELRAQCFTDEGGGDEEGPGSCGENEYWDDYYYRCEELPPEDPDPDPPACESNYVRTLETALGLYNSECSGGEAVPEPWTAEDWDNLTPAEKDLVLADPIKWWGRRTVMAQVRTEAITTAAARFNITGVIPEGSEANAWQHALWIAGMVRAFHMEETWIDFAVPLSVTESPAARDAKAWSDAHEDYTPIFPWLEPKWEANKRMDLWNNSVALRFAFSSGKGPNSGGEAGSIEQDIINAMAQLCWIEGPGATPETCGMST